MLQTSTTDSPKSVLADLFLDKFDSTSNLRLANPALRMDRTFDQILDNNIKLLRGADTSDPAHLGLRMGNRPRRNPLDELTHQVEGLGIPQNALSLNQQDLDRLAKVLRESGIDDDKIQEAMEKLSDGPLTMDRVMAAIGPLKNELKGSLRLTEENLPILGKFLQDAGLGADQVKNVLANLKIGQRFGADALRDILLKNGDDNLKGMNLSDVDPENLKSLLASMGVGESDQNKFWAKMKQTRGRMSLEAFLGFLKSVERPDALSLDQANNIREMMRSMLMSKSFKGSPHFNRVLSLLQSMGDKEIDQNFLQSNPAIQALRSGPASTKAILGGNLGQGGSNGSGQGGSNGSGQGLGGMFDGQLKTAEASAGKARGAGLTSRLSESVFKQVAEKMIYQANNNQHRLKLQLTPPELGKLNINMVVKANVVHATIIADNPLVKDALEEQMAQLKDNLAKQGLDLGSFDISYRDQGRQAENQKEERRAWDFQGDAEPDPESEEENERQPMLGRRRGGVDRHV